MVEPAWWSRHYLRAWEERAGNPDLPKWFRVMALAYGKQRSNGHCPFAQGDVAFMLGSVDLVSGEYAPDDNARHHIALAVRYGLLAPNSSVRCLVLPAHAVEGGIGGASMANAPCSWHDRRRSKTTKSVSSSGSCTTGLGA